jgi:rhodanese-related sulfurtransferase
MKAFGIFIAMMLSVGLSAQLAGINRDFQKEIEKYIDNDVPVITLEQIDDFSIGSYILLDAREKEEYKVSTIPGAIHIGYDDFDKSSLENLPKDKKIIVFCSIGYRSEVIGRKFVKAGFNDVFNLYGSIFAWANAGKTLVKPNGNVTNEVHTYNEKWSKWVINPKVKKVY